MNRAIFINELGTVSVVIPSDEALEKLGMQKIAERDIPKGKPFKIIDASEVPDTREGRASWKVDKKFLTDGVGTFDRPAI